MPYAAKKPCLAFNCGVLSDHSYCPEHTRQKKVERDRQRSNARHRGYDYKWEKDRARYLRENPLCTIHLQDGRTERATVVDHIIPHRGNRKLFEDESNWQGLCTTCHNRKTATEPGGPFENAPGRLTR